MDDFPASHDRRGLWYWLGSGAATLIIGVVAISFLFYTPPVAETAPTPSPTPGQAEPATGEPTPSAGQPNHYASARADLLAIVEQRRADLPPEAFATVMDNLNIIDRSIVEIAAALEKNPGNTRLSRLLTTAYWRELDLLRTAATLP